MMLQRTLRLLASGPGKALPLLPRAVTSLLGSDGIGDKAMSSVGEATFDLEPYRLHKLETGPATTTTLTKEDAFKYYSDMMHVRRMEGAAANLYKEKVVRGFCHLFAGQEAVCVGIKAGMRDVDSLITAYRVHGFAYVMGIPISGVLGELAGKASGCVRGKGGSMHMYTPKMFGGNGIVGAQVPLGTGVAFAHNYKNDGGVCFTLYGDGAAQQGQVFESYNMAKLWNLPVVFICENNGYGMGTSQDRSSASDTFYTRGDYIPGVRVNGMDVLSVREATRFAIDYCTSGKGPLVYEMVTYRYHGHSMSDPGTSYRSREEIQEVRRSRDPITGFKEKLVSSGLVDVEQLKKIEQDARKQVEADVKKVKADVEIDSEQLFHDVYEKAIGPVRGLVPWEVHEHKRNSAKALNV